MCYKYIPHTGLGRSESGLKDDATGKESKMGTRKDGTKKNGTEKSVHGGVDTGQQDVKSRTNR